MPNYVIGNDKGLTPAYTAAEIDLMMQQKANVSQLNTLNTTVANHTTQITNINTNLNAKQKKITSGTAAPSGGSNGDIYIQY